MDGQHGVFPMECPPSLRPDIIRYDEDGHAVHDAFVIGIAGAFFFGLDWLLDVNEEGNRRVC